MKIKILGYNLTVILRNLDSQLEKFYKITGFKGEIKCPRCKHVQRLLVV